MLYYSEEGVAVLLCSLAVCTVSSGRAFLLHSTCMLDLLAPLLLCRYLTPRRSNPTFLS